MHEQLLRLNIVALICAETLGPISYTEGEEPCIMIRDEISPLSPEVLLEPAATKYP